MHNCRNEPFFFYTWKSQLYNTGRKTVVEDSVVLDTTKTVSELGRAQQPSGPRYLDEGLAGVLAEPWHHGAVCVGDVVPEHRHVHALLLCLLLTLVVQGHQVVSQTPVIRLVLGVQHEEDQVKPEETW